MSQFENVDLVNKNILQNIGMQTQGFYYANKYVTNNIVERTTIDKMLKLGHGILSEKWGNVVKSEIQWRGFLKFT